MPTSQTKWADWVRAGDHNLTCVFTTCENKSTDVFLGWWENGVDSIPMLETPCCPEHLNHLEKSANGTSQES